MIVFFGFNDGRRWKIEGDGGIEFDRPQRIEPTIETTPEEPLSKSNEVKNPPKLERAANPQAEDGHVDIANEIVEALAKVNLSAYESRILWVIFRKTYGWHKKTDQVSITQFEKATGLKRRHVHRTLSELIKRKIVIRIGNRSLPKGVHTKETNKRNIYVEGDEPLRLSSLLLNVSNSLRGAKDSRVVPT